MVKETSIITKVVHKSSSSSSSSSIIGEPQSILVKKKFYLNLSVNRFNKDDKINYKIDYVLLNGHQDLIPEKNILKLNIETSILTINQAYTIIYIFNIPNIQLFNSLDLMDYKIRSTIFSMKSDSDQNIFSKFLNIKKLYVKNNNNIELVRPISIKTKTVEKTMSDLFAQITIE